VEHHDDGRRPGGAGREEEVDDRRAGEGNNNSFMFAMFNTGVAMFNMGGNKPTPPLHPSPLPPQPKRLRHVNASMMNGGAA